MNKINYKFEDLDKLMSQLKTNPSHQNLTKLKYELNKLFKDSNCREVIYTNNTDKIFFGMCVMPYLEEKDTSLILTTDKKIRISQYYLEIDSKLFEIGLSTRELTAVLLHEIGHIVNSSTPVEETRKSIDVYLSKNNEHLIISDAAQYNDIIAYGIKDTIRKLNSIFDKNDEEVLADEFVISCGYGMELETALTKIIKNAASINKNVSNKLIVLQWILRLYKDVKYKRIAALHTINKSKKITGSVLQKRELNNLSRRLEEIDDSFMITESVNLFKKMYKDFKYKGIRSFEDDLFELSLRAKNVTDQDEALIILRQINTRLSVIDDYIRTEELDEKEKDRWYDLQNKYSILRYTLSKKTTYEKYLGLFVNTPVIKSRYEL